MVASRLLARISRQCVAAAAAFAAVQRPGAARVGLAAAAEPFAGSFSSIRVPHMLNQNLRCATSIFQRFWFSSASPQESDKANGEPSNESSSLSGSEKAPEEGKEDLDLSKEDLFNLVHEKDGLLKSKDDEIKDMKEKVLRSYAEMENVIARTKLNLRTPKSMQFRASLRTC